jgi:hypothetical protein
MIEAASTVIRSELGHYDVGYGESLIVAERVLLRVIADLNEAGV